MPVQTNKVVLAIDAGQTGIRTEFQIAGQDVSKDFDGLRTDLELFSQLAAVIKSSIGEFATDAAKPVTVAIGMTGLTRANSQPQALLALLGDEVSELYLAHDSVSGFLGAMGLNTGVVTAVGTGVVTMAVGASKSARVDGWGNLIGDAGSAYWIGRAGLEAGMKSYDGRIPKSALLELLTNNFSNPEEAYIELQTDENRVARIASYARQVIEAAESDSAAREIIQQAARELALSAVTAARIADTLSEAAPRFSWAGNVMQAKLLREQFAAEILDSVPTAQVVEPVSKPIDGVALLNQLTVGSPLHDSIYVAKRS